jgi:hypothetical protein
MQKYMQNTRYTQFQGEPHNSYFSPNIILVIKSRKRWEMHIVRMGERRGNIRCWWRNLRERDHVGGGSRESEDNIKMCL